MRSPGLGTLSLGVLLAGAAFLFTVQPAQGCPPMGPTITIGSGSGNTNPVPRVRLRGQRSRGAAVTARKNTGRPRISRKGVQATPAPTTYRDLRRVAAGRSGPQSDGSRDSAHWLKSPSLEIVLKLTEGSETPLLVFLEVNDVDDCCGARLHHTFGYKPFIELSHRFECFHVRGDLTAIQRSLEPYGVTCQRSVMLILDGDGLPIHYQDRCVDSKTCVRGMSWSLARNSERMGTRVWGAQKYQKALVHKANARYAKSLSLLDRIAAQSLLLPEDLEVARVERENLVDIGEALLARGQADLERRRYGAAYDTFKDVRREFARITPLRREAERLARQAYLAQKTEELRR